MDARTKFASLLSSHSASCALQPGGESHASYVYSALSQHNQLMTTNFYRYAGG